MQTEHFSMSPASYSPPTLTLVGTLEEMTMGTSSGPQTDKAFPVNTPKSQLTFS